MDARDTADGLGDVNRDDWNVFLRFIPFVSFLTIQCLLRELVVASVSLINLRPGHPVRLVVRKLAETRVSRARGVACRQGPSVNIAFRLVVNFPRRFPVSVARYS